MRCPCLIVWLLGVLVLCGGAGAFPQALAQGRWFEVYFSQVGADQSAARANPQSLDRVLAGKIAAAQYRIDMAMHEIDSELLTEALRQAHQRGVRLRLVTEHDYADEISIQDLQEAGVPVVTDAGRNGLMHNKFLVIDQRFVWTGSFNATDNDAYKNNNNALWIDSPALAANFTSEFLEMFEARQFGAASPSALPYPAVTMPDGTAIWTFFAPENAVETALATRLGAASSRILFLAFAFTHDGLGDILRQRFRAGVEVRGVFETRGASVPQSEYRKMHDAGMAVQLDTNPWNMHHKVIILDDDTVATGSFNFSRNAAQTNDENLLILQGNRELVQLYHEEFTRVAGPSSPPRVPPPVVPGQAVLLPINTATQAELERLPGIGPTLAQRIIAGRPYQDFQDLRRVRGLGARKIEIMKGLVTFQ